MNVVAQPEKNGRIVFLDVCRNYIEVASIEPCFSGWVATVGDDPGDMLDMVFDCHTLARQAVYAELIRRGESGQTSTTESTV